jgi:hypothetical protein
MRTKSIWMATYGLAIAAGLLTAVAAWADNPGMVPWTQSDSSDHYPYCQCPHTQGPCFGSGTCEAYWNDPAFNCGGTTGQSLQRSNWRSYGDCVQLGGEGELPGCDRYASLQCAIWNVYPLGGCAGQPCGMIGSISSKCL